MISFPLWRKRHLMYSMAPWNNVTHQLSSFRSGEWAPSFSSEIDLGERPIHQTNIFQIESESINRLDIKHYREVRNPNRSCRTKASKDNITVESTSQPSKVIEHRQYEEIPYHTTKHLLDCITQTDGIIMRHVGLWEIIVESFQKLLCGSPKTK